LRAGPSTQGRVRQQSGGYSAPHSHRPHRAHTVATWTAASNTCGLPRPLIVPAAQPPLTATPCMHRPHHSLHSVPRACTHSTLHMLRSHQQTHLRVRRQTLAQAPHATSPPSISRTRRSWRCTLPAPKPTHPPPARGPPSICASAQKAERPRLGDRTQNQTCAARFLPAHAHDGGHGMLTPTTLPQHSHSAPRPTRALSPRMPAERPPSQRRPPSGSRVGSRAARPPAPAEG